MIGRIFGFLKSSRLALVLLLLILVACLIGSAILPQPVGTRVVFRSLWFNALLVLLVINTACCFFGKIRRRGWNLISAGMVIFHLSFVAMFLGIVIDTLFFFKGSLRLTEGETLAMGDPVGYDAAEWGPFFNHDWMRGTVTLKKLHTQFREGNDVKGLAEEIEIREEGRLVQGVIYPTKHLAFEGFRFFRSTDGFAPLFVVYDHNGNESAGSFVSLQSLKRKGAKEFFYTTGTKAGPGTVLFPEPGNSLPSYQVQFIYNLPKTVKDPKTATIRVFKGESPPESLEKPLWEGSVALGERLPVGDFAIGMKEVRYWGSMDVLYNPGQPVVLCSLWAGLFGLALTMIGRMQTARTTINRVEN